MLALSLGSASCIESYNGSKIEILLHGGVQLPGDSAPGFGRPPSDTHFEIYAVKDNATFHLSDFDLRPVIRRADPCFIEEEDARFPGLHSTQIVEKLKEAAQADGTVSALEAGDIAVAKERVADMQALELSLKVLVFHEPGLTDAQVAALITDIPSADRIDDASNAERLSKCRAAFKGHPGYYVGTDKILTIPINGTYLGMVEAMDPRNSGLLGGGQIDVGVNLAGVDALRINWNFNNPDDPRKAAYSPSKIGWHYMAGPALRRVRGVVNVALVNEDFGMITGEASIYTELEDDDVHF